MLCQQLHDQVLRAGKELALSIAGRLYAVSPFIFSRKSGVWAEITEALREGVGVIAGDAWLRDLENSRSIVSYQCAYDALFEVAPSLDIVPPRRAIVRLLQRTAIFMDFSWRRPVLKR